MEVTILPYNNVTPHLLGAAVPPCALVSSGSMSLFLCPDESNPSYSSLGLPGGDSVSLDGRLADLAPASPLTDWCSFDIVSKSYVREEVGPSSEDTICPGGEAERQPLEARPLWDREIPG